MKTIKYTCDKCNKKIKNELISLEGFIKIERRDENGGSTSNDPFHIHLCNPCKELFQKEYKTHLSSIYSHLLKI